MNMPLMGTPRQAVSTPPREARVEQLLTLLRTQEESHLIYRGMEASTVLRYLQRCVAARPVQLRNHIRRIYLAIQCGDKGQVYGALIDLACVLKGRGLLLQHRLLEQARPLLESEHVGRIREAFTGGDLRALRGVPDTHSVLMNALLPLVVRTR